ncbi:MAG: DUF2628 domain-containing protein [Alphaproteobacteria bacterium]|nr:DUF2628 domain-containing protein [Alphaproteobacteria bacterium]
MINEVKSKLIANDEELKQLLEVHLGKPKQVEKIFQLIKNHYENGRLKKSAFNIWAFLGGLFYFLYRKMYYTAGIIFVIMFISTFINVSSSAISAGMSAGCAFAALPLYLEKFFRDAEKSGYGQRPLEEVKQEMAKKGGYNNWAILLLFLVTAIIVFAEVYA